jgi:sulfate transport system substrate-binding protein
MAWVLTHPFRGEEDLLVVGYDSSRGYVSEVSQLFAETRPSGAGQLQSLHAGSVQQAESLALGLAADIVLLASEAEMDFVQARTRCLDPDWQEAFPHGSSPFYSTIILLVRKGNPHGIREWKDLYKEDVRVTLPDPRWSGAGRYAYLALMADALKRHGNDQKSAEEEVRSLVMRLNLIPLGTQSALDVFSRKANQDVFLTWESEAMRVTGPAGTGEYDVVYPSASIKAEPVVAVMTCQTEKRNTTGLAQAFIAFLFSPEGQQIAIRNGLRPRDSMGASPAPGQFPSMDLQEVETLYGSWKEVWKQHLGPEGSFSYALKIKAALEGGVE